MSRRSHTDAPGRPARNTGVGLIYTACQLADRYPDRIPDWQELVAHYGFARATAFRWIHAMKAARGVPNSPRPRAMPRTKQNPVDHPWRRTANLPRD